MRPVIVLLVLCAFVSSSFAGINEGGVLVVHHDPQLVYSASCGDLTLPGDCSQLNPTAAADGTPQKWFVIAAFPDDVSDRLNTITFGLGQYDPEDLAMGSWGPCDIIGSPLEVATADWPDPGEGTAVSWAPDCLGGEMVPVYWFLTYAYSNGTIPLTAHSVHGGFFVECSASPQSDGITDYGTMGFGMAGSNPCPGGLDDGEDGGGEEPWVDGGEDGGSDSPEAPFGEYLMPSNDTAPFAQIDIYSDQLFAAGCVDSFLPGSFYPSMLDDEELLVLRDYVDTVGVFNSYANDGIQIRYDASCPDTYLEYEVNPPRRATGLFMLATGSLPFPENIGQALATVRVTYDDDTTTEDSLRVGGHLREWHKTHPYAPPDCDVFVLDPPTDDLAGEVWGGFGYSPPDTGWYDVQEFLLPSEVLEKRVTRIRIMAEMNGVWCDSSGGELGEVFVESGTIVHGMSLAVDFQIRNGEADTVVTHRQNDVQWGDHAYGGILVDDAVIGSWRDLSALGCYLACFSMLSSFYGTECDPDTLNEWVVAQGGYEPIVRGTIEDPVGQEIGDTLSVRSAVARPFRQGDRVVIERSNGPRNPLAWAEFIPPHDGGIRRAVILDRYSPSTLIQAGDIARSYTLLNPIVASRFGPSRQYRIELLGLGSDTVERVERAMASSHPVALHTRYAAGAFQHWVVGDGMRPHFDAIGGEHRGTYRIHDPAWGANELLYWRFENTFGRVVLTEPTTPIVEEGNNRLVVTLAGPAVLRMIDPIGRTLEWDGSTYDTDIPGCLAMSGYAIGEPADTIPDFEVEFVSVASPIDGDYLIAARGTGAGEVGLTIAGYDSTGGYSDDTRHYETDTGDVHDYMASYSSSPDTIIHVQELDPASAPSDSQIRRVVPWKLVPNPTSLGTEIIFNLLGSSRVHVAVYDISGRQIIRLVDGALMSGPQRFRWNGLGADGERVAAGVYFVELKINGRAGAKKIVVVK
ncbi:MAG: T9SS type A sorting domain-containing protein [Candidatus Eisenbacteria bacterium]|nr:T9SS type A sorting domain-containing protein [Candidatus Eisenbacteria bacterium]